MRSVLWILPVFVAFAAVSCEYEPEFQPNQETDRPPAPASTSFDASACGRVTGRVTWSGSKPTPTPFLFGAPAANGNFTSLLIQNPNAPAINETTRAVPGAIVFLRGIDPTRAQPWDLPAVRIELKDRNIRVIQGDSAGRTGFVRRGDSVEMKSVEPVYHILRARGATFFSLTFPKPDQPLSRQFDSAGRVELSSGSGFYWANADLFVADHPYWTRTDPEGRFVFETVPHGEFQVVAWLPGWDVAKQERDPETGLISRQTYSAPIEASERVTLDAKGAAVASLTLSK